ncbi:hypothetical protein ACFW6M_00005 [Streptomyces nigra]|uniref:hypothetical protein n=1 Tax=Streptomyces nigra TaxID=1827580 RepID=UPI0036822215
MPDNTSPLWWLFAVLSALIFLALWYPGMINNRQRAVISCPPLLCFVVLIGLSRANDESVVEWLPVYCAMILGFALAAVGHWKALRTFMAWRAENPEKPDSEGPDTPWVLQLAVTLPGLSIPAFLLFK